MMRLLCAASPCAGTGALEAVSHGTKALLFCWGSADELGNEWAAFPSWGYMRPAAAGSSVTAAG